MDFKKDSPNPISDDMNKVRAALEKVMSEDLSEIWTILNADEKRKITDNFAIHHFKKNQIIYAENEAPEYLWCLLKGKAKLHKDGAGNRTQILRLIRPVQYFGYRAFFAEESYVSTAATIEPSILGTIPMTVVKELIDQNISVAWFFIRELSHNLGRSDTNIVNLTQKHLRGRLAEALIALKDSYGYEEDGTTIRVYMGRQDLANLSNMTTANAIRTLTDFGNERIIVVDGRTIKIIDEKTLVKISRFG